MKRETLFEAIGAARDSYVQEAQSFQEVEAADAARAQVSREVEAADGAEEQVSREVEAADAARAQSFQEVEAADAARAKESRKRWRPALLAAAACVGLAAAAAVLPGVLRHGGGGTGEALPKLSVSQDDGAFGFEGYLAYSVDELADNSPWTPELELTALPVYRNRHPADGAGVAEGDEKELAAQVNEIAERLGVTGMQLSAEQSPGEGDTRIYAVVGKGEQATITAYASQSIRVEFDPAAALPEGLNFTNNDSSYEEMEAVGDYLKDAYAKLLHMERPIVNVTGGDRTFDGRQSYQPCFYEGAGSTADRMAAHDLRSMRFCCDDNGRLWIVWINTCDLSEKVGDYPIISPAEAEELLYSGHYITSVPVGISEDDPVVRTELIYRGDATAEYYMPYYRFLVERPAEALGFDPKGMADGLKDYCVYYVPAVREAYLTEMPVWDGSYN